MAEFDEFLAQESQRYDSARESELITEQLKADFDRLLDECAVPTAFRFDDEQREMYAFTADADIRERVRSDGIQLKRTFMLIWGLYRYPGQAGEDATKKAIMAELFIYAGREKGSPWLKFADQLLPDTEPLDFDSIESVPYINNAARVSRTREQQRNLFDDVVINCVQHLIREAETEEVELDNYKMALNRCAKVYTMDDHQRDATIDEAIRTSGLSRQSVLAICRAYERYYDAVGGYFSVGLL